MSKLQRLHFRCSASACCFNLDCQLEMTQRPMQRAFAWPRACPITYRKYDSVCHAVLCFVNLSLNLSLTPVYSTTNLSRLSSSSHFKHFPLTFQCHVRNSAIFSRLHISIGAAGQMVHLVSALIMVSSGPFSA